MRSVYCPGSVQASSQGAQVAGRIGLVEDEELAAGINQRTDDRTDWNGTELSIKRLPRWGRGQQRIFVFSLTTAVP